MIRQVDAIKISTNDGGSGEERDNIRSSRATITSEQKLAVGGSDGIKRAVLLTLLGKEQNRRLWFFSKEYRIEEEDELKKIVKAYAVFRRFKLPVPNTTRYYLDKTRKKFYLGSCPVNCVNGAVF